jgi:putative SOS response-associated peptidase YedK
LVGDAGLVIYFEHLTMFVRYSIAASSPEIADKFTVDVPPGYKPIYNAAPTHLLPVVTQDSQQGVSFFYWGAPPSWANKKPLGEKIINTRSEQIPEKSVLRKKLVDKRCLVLADGFYAWKKIGKKTSVPYRFTLKDRAPFCMAGLWEEYDDAQDNINHTFSVITTAPTEETASICERLPVILDTGSQKKWLNATDESGLVSLLRPYAGILEYYTVSPRINSPEQNDKLLIMPAPGADQFGNLTLFD